MNGHLTKKIAFGAFSLVASLLISGATYQYISTQLDEKNYPPFGKLIDVGGYKLHIQKDGEKGPTVILDSGLGCISSDWTLVQKEASKFAQVVSYDRAGTGWSEKSHLPRTSKHIIKELHTLLENAKIEKPYILVGHSFGGINMQLFAITYPDEVSGLVLVDSCHENIERKKTFRPIIEKIKLMMNPHLVYFLSTFGISRCILKFYSNRLFDSYPTVIRERNLAICSSQKHICTVAREYTSLTASLNELKSENRGQIKDKPCYIISAGLLTDLSNLGYPRDKTKTLNQIFSEWNDLQRDLAAKFNDSHHIIAEKSDHMIPWKEPELIVSAISKLL